MSWRQIRTYILVVLYIIMCSDYFMPILTHKVGGNANIGHFGYVQFAK